MILMWLRDYTLYHKYQLEDVLRKKKLVRLPCIWKKQLIINKQNNNCFTNIILTLIMHISKNRIIFILFPCTWNQTTTLYCQTLIYWNDNICYKYCIYITCSSVYYDKKLPPFLGHSETFLWTSKKILSKLMSELSRLIKVYLLQDMELKASDS